MKLFYCSPGRRLLYLVCTVFIYLMLINSLKAGAQPSFIIQGKVLTAMDEMPLVGANIQLKHTALGATTDSQGAFVIKASQSTVELTVSFIGYRSLDTTVTLPLRSPLIFVLSQDLSLLQEVKVSTGYWESTRQLNTGAISKIAAETIQKQPVTNVLEALSGRMPGVSIQQTSGLAGAPINISIRGQNSLRADGNNPLYVIDGIPFSASIAAGLAGELYSGNISPLNSLNPSDIESIEILKDADATAIYGSRGANGVVLITTKKGRQGKTKLEVNFSQGAGRISRKMKVLNTPQYLQMRREAFANDGVEPTLNNAPDLLSWDPNRYTDWQKELVGNTSSSTNAQAQLSAGNERTHFILSGSLHRETTVFPGNFAYLRGAGHLQLRHATKDQRLKVNVSVNYVADKNNLMRQNLASQALTIAPNAPQIYLPSGELNWAASSWQNPMSYLRQTYKAVNDNLLTSMTVSYHLLSGLDFKVSGGFTTLNTSQQTSSPVSYFNPAYGVKNGEASFATALVKTWIAEPQLQYEKALGPGTLSVLAGMTFQQNKLRNQTLYATGYSSDAMLGTSSAAASVLVTADNQSEYRYRGIYSRLNYNLKDKYLLNLTARRDGSSRFGPNRQYANFAAAGLGWLFYQENFMKEAVPFLSFGKIRVSYGSSGSDQIPDYGFLDTYSSTAYSYNGQKGLYPTRLVNADFSWEKSRKLDIALETGLFQDRFRLTADWFNNVSTGQLVGYPLPSVTGQSQIQYNLPARVRNSGWEFELNTQYLRKTSVQWSGTINLTIPKNKLIDYPGLAGSSYANTYAIKEPLSIRKTYEYVGVDPASGTYRFKDADNSGTFNAIDRTAIVFTGQRFFGGLGNTVRYRGVELDFFLQFVRQTGANYRRDVFGMPGAWGLNNSNQPAEVLDRWQKTGDLTSNQKFSQNYAISNPVYKQFTEARSYGENSYSDASFIRLKNVSISWRVPLRAGAKGGLAGPRIFIQAQNALTFTRYKGWDPEQASVGYLPPLRVLSAGINQVF
ncbi:TonB-linked outer membrane protein, SusC/RagA family [Dyadobacter koreensis]|uniref:TonB-linked outer membrane protein, SusC/RagA family n=1 Tax=Dyadobacter koreensis TaxID=408657 RepID=A0A1H6Q738_9BACT|nr:SusC/RagA family TonB-linked outer membrane protein [Dyadobacter koreensis]SEI39621.1 TonB-linked outer membrane protein, SusC/RagA family [Dyadobacter koreensis]